MSFPAHAEEVLYLYIINESETIITPSPKRTMSNPTPSKCRSLMKVKDHVVEQYFSLALSRDIPSLVVVRVVKVKISPTSDGKRSCTFNFQSIANPMIIRTVFRASRLALPRRLPISSSTSPRPCRFGTTSISQLSNHHRSYATKTTIDEKVEELQEL